MPRYLKELDHIITLEEAQKMITKANNDRDKFLISFMYLTGARPHEFVRRLKPLDFTWTLDGYFRITIPNAKQGSNKNSTKFPKRVLEFSETAPFANYIIPYVQSLNLNDYVIPVCKSRVRQIVYALSDNTFFPYNFRHSRITKLSVDGASLTELMYWKGASSTKSVEPYLAAKPIGRKLVVK